MTISLNSTDLKNLISDMKQIEQINKDITESDYYIEATYFYGDVVITDDSEGNGNMVLLISADRDIDQINRELNACEKKMIAAIEDADRRTGIFENLSMIGDGFLRLMYTDNEIYANVIIAEFGRE